MRKLPAILLGAFIVTSGPSVFLARAQDVDEVQELQRVISLQQQQLDAQRQQLDSQKQVLENLQQQVQLLLKQANQKNPAPAVAATAPTASAPKETAEVPAAPIRKKAPLSEADRYDPVDPTGSNARIDDSKNIKIEGAKTQIGVHGNAEFQMMGDTHGINANEFDTLLITSGSPSQTLFNVNPSRLEFSSSTPFPRGPSEHRHHHGLQRSIG